MYLIYIKKKIRKLKKLVKQILICGGTVIFFLLNVNILIVFSKIVIQKIAWISF
jgi:hypothetical protein